LQELRVADFGGLAAPARAEAATIGGDNDLLHGVVPSTSTELDEQPYAAEPRPI
jgi:hypothetical protein